LIVGGTFDASGDQRAKTINTLELHSAAYANLDNGADSISVSNPILNFGGRIAYDPNAVFVVS